jgi:Flp pilus assembly protein TadB
VPQRRRRKHRGTQAGTVKRARGRPRTRAEARGSSEQRRQQRLNQPPTWRGALMRGLIAAVSLFALATLLLGASVGESVGLALFAAAIYVPAFHAVDTFAYRRRQRKRQEAAE